jgi:hypothetical protein
MITVNGENSDYAIMKQVQQLKLAYPHMAVVTLDDKTDFSALAADERLYLVSHGNVGNGNLRDIKRAPLLSWLTDQHRGVPKNFGGIVILSCYSGLQVKSPEPSLAAYLATGLAGRAAAATPVAGANGFSFGTPEFKRSGYSSVVSMDLAAFYFAHDDGEMTKAWLKHRPTHTGGVLKDKLKINVDTSKTIEEHLVTVQQAPPKTPEEITKEFVAAFAKEAKAIEAKLEDIIENKIPGSTVAERADYLVNNDKEADVITWNATIDTQYELFHGLYLWASPADAFTVAKVA